MMYRDSLAVLLCANCAQYLLLVRSTAQLCMRYSKKRVFNTQPVLVAIEMYRLHRSSSTSVARISLDLQEQGHSANERSIQW
jgi:hypothetical protein